MESVYAAALCALPGFGAAKVRQVIESFGSAEAAWKSGKELEPSGCLSSRDCRTFCGRHTVVSAEVLAQDLHRSGIRLTSWQSKDYPRYLKHIYNPPAVLFYRGDLACLCDCLAIVGSRRATPYGKATAEKFAAQAARRGLTVVSGAAYGIDTAAHKGALQSGRTAAVLGCGVDVAYPRENAGLLESIVASGGIVLSEYPPQTAPLAKHFPARNRIIAGLAQATLVVEAALKSGSLITAEFALEEGRSVLAVPGSIYAENSRGCHRLLKQGAKLVEDIDDILAEYTGCFSAAPSVSEQRTLFLSVEEQAVYSALSDTEMLSMDEIIIKTSRKADHIAYILLQLELKGLVRQEGSLGYMRTL